MKKEEIKESIDKKINDLIREVENLEGSYRKLGMLHDYYVYQEKVINGLTRDNFWTAADFRSHYIYQSKITAALLNVKKIKRMI